MRTIIKQLLLTTLLITGFLTANAQPPAGFSPMGGAPASGRISGKITDSTGKAMEGASVLILQNKWFFGKVSGRGKKLSVTFVEKSEWNSIRFYPAF